MSIESKIPLEELNIKDIALEQAEVGLPQTERLRKLADTAFFHAAEEQIKVEAGSDLNRAIEKAAWLKLAFPNHKQNFLNFLFDERTITQAVKDTRAQRKQGFNITSYLYLLAHLKVLFPGRPEFWSPKPKEVPLFKKEIRRQAKRMESGDHTGIILFGHSGATYKILQPQDNEFIQEVFSKPAVRDGIHEQLDAVVFNEQFHKPVWWSAIDQVAPYTMVDPEDAHAILHKSKAYFSSLESYLKTEKLEKPEKLSEAIVMFSNGLEVTDSRVSIKLPTAFSSKKPTLVPETKKF